MSPQKTHDELRMSRLGILIEAALAYFISITVTGAFLARLTTSLGFSDSLTGILSSFVSMGCLFQLSVLFLFRNIKSVKRTSILFQLINELLFALLYLTPIVPLSPGQKSAVFVVFFCITHVFGNLIVPAKVDWMMSLIDDHTRGIFSARKEMLSLFGGMVFTYLMGSAIDALEAAGNLRLAFVVCAVTVLVLTVLHTLSMLVIQDTPPVSAPEVKFADCFKGLFADRTVRCIVIVNALWTVARSCAMPFYGAYEVNELGFSMTFVSILSILYSVTRIACSPTFGRYADRHSFARMICICFLFAAAGFLVNCFTVPANGKVFFSLYYMLNAVSMAGINSGLVNLVYDNIKGENRRNALALTTALGGVAGFAATCLMSPVVSLIQRNGNRLFGFHMYAAQFVSAVALVLTLLLVLFMRLTLLKKSKE